MRDKTIIKGRVISIPCEKTGSTGAAVVCLPPHVLFEWGVATTIASVKFDETVGANGNDSIQSLLLRGTRYCFTNHFVRYMRSICISDLSNRDGPMSSPWKLKMCLSPRLLKQLHSRGIRRYVKRKVSMRIRVVSGHYGENSRRTRHESHPSNERADSRGVV